MSGKFPNKKRHRSTGEIRTGSYKKLSELDVRVWEWISTSARSNKWQSTGNGFDIKVK